MLDQLDRALSCDRAELLPVLADRRQRRMCERRRLEVVEIIGDVAGCDAIVVDDFTISAGTLVEVADQLVGRGARSVTAVVTHGVFAEGSMERLDDSPIERLIVTDSIETQPVELSPRVSVVSVAPLFAEAIRRIHERESISVLFQE